MSKRNKDINIYNAHVIWNYGDIYLITACISRRVLAELAIKLSICRVYKIQGLFCMCS